MNHRNRLATASFLALLCALFANQVQGQCVPDTAVTSSISLIETPFAYTAHEPPLTPGEIAALPALPNPATETTRREHAYISTALAASLGFEAFDTGGDLTVQADWRRPNPQIRVRITNPATFSNWQSGTTFRDRSSNAVFTVVGIIEDARRIVWVYEGFDGAAVVSDSGQYKLFAEDSFTAAPNGTRNRDERIRSFPDDDGDTLLDTVAAAVYCSPVSSSQVAEGNRVTLDRHFTESDAHGGWYKEWAGRANDNRFVLLIPHGEAIEPGTTDQLIPFFGILSSVYDIPMNTWKSEGKWSDGQTSPRWHVTSDSISEQSYPALRELLEQRPWFDADSPFRRSLSFHGFTSNRADIIIGGGTSLNAKCHVATRIKAEAGMGPVAVRIYDDNEIIDIPGSDGHEVCRKNLDGGSRNNIANRLAQDGGIQVEQSATVRSTSAYRNAVAYGAARAVGDLLTGAAPTDACSIYPDPVDEDLIPDC